MTELHRPPITIVRNPLKRTVDSVLSGIGLVVLAPFMLVIGVVIMRGSPGGMFYSQMRVGRAGVLFRCYKFRTMVAGADKLGGSITIKNDSRITRIGQFLRRTKLDELPQLWNVLRGEMSLVGSRPEVPSVVAHYTAEQWHVFAIRPGITSLATIHLRDEEAMLALAKDPDTAYETEFVPLKIRLAMTHVYRNSVIYDTYILLLTVWAVIFRFLPVKEHPEVAHLRDRLMRGEV